jgi:hypothetical protein
MTRKIKQYNPIKFGDGPDLDTVEGHRKAMAGPCQFALVGGSLEFASVESR